MIGVYHPDIVNTPHHSIRSGDKIWECSYPTHPARALPGDQVQFVIGGEDRDVQVVKILHRNQAAILGVLHTSSNTIHGFKTNKRGAKIPRKLFVPYDSRYPHFTVATKVPFKGTDTYATIIPAEWGPHMKYPIGHIQRILGEVGDYAAEKECIKVKNVIRWPRYPDIDPDILTTDLYPQREDMTSAIAISIDPPGCKDIDDALHCTVISSSLVALGVHIADVSSYLIPGSALDLEVQKRGQSNYLATEQNNMLPDIMATNLCSLIQDQPRRALSLCMVYDLERDQITDCRFRRTVIVNRCAMSYDEAESIIGDSNHALYPTLSMLYRIAGVMYSRSTSTSTSRSLLQDPTPFDTHKMVEMYMVYANVVAAQQLYSSLGGEALLRVCSGAKSTLLAPDQSQLLNPVTKEIISQVNIYKMDRAKYSLGSTDGHQPLGEPFYTHFTSPIRRYADIVVHRQLSKVLNHSSSTSTSTSTNIGYTSLVEHLNWVSYHSKVAERESHLLELVYRLHGSNRVDSETDATVVGIRDTVLTLYIPSYGLSIQMMAISNKIAHLVQHSNNSEETSLSITYGGESCTYSLLDQVKIRIVVTLKTPYAKRKFKIQILNMVALSDPMELDSPNCV